MIRRTIAAAAAAVAVAALLPLSASAARPAPTPLAHAPAKAGVAAVGTCTLSAPSRVAIGRPYLALYPKISGDCTQAGSLSGWRLTHPTKGPVLDLVYQAGATTDLWDVLSSDPIGTQTWAPLGSWNPGDNPLTQNAPKSTVKLAAGAWISSSRTGDVVTLKGTSLLYSVSTDKYFKRSAGGVFQFREVGSNTWQTLKNVWTNSAGEVTLAYRYSKTRDYRFALYSTSISWDLGSAVTRR
jgi:hypothetical protein